MREEWSVAGGAESLSVDVAAPGPQASAVIRLQIRRLQRILTVEARIGQHCTNKAQSDRQSHTQNRFH